MDFGQTAIVIIEIEKEGKTPELRYVTIGLIGKKANEDELKCEALNYIDSDGTKTVKDIIIADNNQYKVFIENSLVDYANKDN